MSRLRAATLGFCVFCTVTGALTATRAIAGEYPAKWVCSGVLRSRRPEHSVIATPSKRRDR